MDTILMTSLPLLKGGIRILLIPVAVIVLLLLFWEELLKILAFLFVCGLLWALGHLIMIGIALATQ